MTKHLYVIPIVVLASFILTTQKASALSPQLTTDKLKDSKAVQVSSPIASPTPKPTLKFDLSKVKLDGSLVKASCTILQNNIDTKVDNFDKNKSQHVEVYATLKVRIQEKLTKWQDAGLDTAKLEADLKALDEKIKNFGIDYATYMERLRNTRNYTCGAPEGAFANALKSARDLLKVVRTDTADIRSYYQTVIRPDIVALKNQVENLKETE